MLFDIVLTINDREHRLQVSPDERLVDVLHDRLGLTGTKKGCGSGDCGACTVLLDGSPIVSCLQLAIACQGKPITTIEGLAVDDEHLHPLQEAFIRHGAVQCGFCTPGMILSAKKLLDDVPDPDDAAIRSALAGNLCRCTGYIKIFDAVKSAGQAIRGGS